MRATLLDTGVIAALLDKDERYHSTCVDVVSEVVGPLVTCEASIAGTLRSAGRAHAGSKRACRHP